MAAAFQTYTNIFSLQQVMPMIVVFNQVTTGDWVTVDKVKGFIPSGGFAGGNVTGNNPGTYTYGTVTINNGGTAYTASSTSIVIQSGVVTRSSNPYYVMTGSGEIIEVLVDSAPTNAASTLTIRRACLGTTASATGLANTNVLCVLNVIICACSSVGTNTMIYGVPLPDEEKAKVASTSPR